MTNTNATQIGFTVLPANAKKGIAPVLILEYLAQLICRAQVERYRSIGEFCPQINEWEGNDYNPEIEVLGQKRTVKIAEHTLLKLCSFAPEMESDIDNIELIAKCENFTPELLKKHLSSKFQWAFVIHTTMKNEPKIVAVKFNKGDFETALNTLKGTIFDIITDTDFDALTCKGGAKIKGNFEHKHIL